MGPKYEYARYCIRYCIPLIVNESPPEIINKIDTHSLQGFSKYIKINKTDLWGGGDIFLFLFLYICNLIMFLKFEMFLIW